MDRTVGHLLDSTVVIAVERNRQTAAEMIRAISRSIGSREMALSSIGYTELMRGLYQERDPNRLRQRTAFFEDLLAAVPIYPYTQEIARLAGEIGGTQARLGLNIPPVDLMIAATALSLNFAILTANQRHFRLIPNLEVIAF